FLGGPLRSSRLVGAGAVAGGGVRSMGEPARITNKTDLQTCLPFERPVFELERKLDELMALSDANTMKLNGELKPLLAKRDRMLKDVVARLGPWERVQIARHPRRPQFRDYATGDQGRAGMLDEWIELKGDRTYGDDKAISTGLARMGPYRFLLI